MSKPSFFGKALLMRIPAWRRLATATAALIVLTGTAFLSNSAPAAAAVPDRLGFVLWNGGVVAAGTTPVGTSVLPLSPGRYQVRFVGQAIGGGVAHVTAINPIAHWCQIESFGPAGGDELVNISCFKFGGTADNTAFTATFYASSGPGISGPYGYVDGNPSGGTISQYNSAGAVNTVTHVGIGKWIVAFPALSTPGPRDGGIQATPVNARVGTHCTIPGWSSGSGGQTVAVWCFNAAGVLLDTRFELTFQFKQTLFGSAFPPSYFGYLWWAPGAGPATTTLNSQGAVNTPASAGVGLVTIKFPRLAKLPDTVQVTATGPNPNWCSLSAVWTHPYPDTLVQNVNCFTVGGTPVDNGFLASLNSKF